MLERLDVLMAWRRMTFKPKKTDSLSVRKGTIGKMTTFAIPNQQIPKANQESVRRLGIWYNSCMKDTQNKVRNSRICYGRPFKHH